MPQVIAQHYETRAYATKARFASYWHQLDEVHRLGEGRLLEIGVGAGFLRRQLREAGVAAMSLDFDPALRPEVVGDLRRLPFGDQSFERVACFQVLEHLPFEHLGSALGELARVCRGRVVLSLPDVGAQFRMMLKIPLLPVWRAMMPLDWILRWPHAFDGQHHWEINRRGYPRRRIERVMAEAGLRVERTYRVFENPYHRFYVLRPRQGTMLAP